jgi:hypothetical protein
MLCISYSDDAYMARTTISISDDLKERMDKARELVNWSAVAAEAFELKLGELARGRTEKVMQDVIDRLRASRIQQTSALEREGRDAGIQWARTDAEYDQLNRVVQINQQINGTDWKYFDVGTWTRLPAQIVGGDPFDRRAAQEFWTKAIGGFHDKRLASEEFLRGFIQGATHIYEQVKDKIL